VFARPGGPWSLFVLDLEAATVTAVPGSEYVFSTRSSLTGRHIVGLRVSSPGLRAGLVLYELATRRWSTLYPGTADWPSFSADGRWVYFFATSAEGTTPTGVYRIRISDRRTELVATPSGLVGDGGFGIPWWGLAPDGSLLTLRSASFWGIYAFDWEAP
jgi:hypothetical protein